ncbi:MAG: Do family serine endopeptidase [Desulfobacterales bacterium]|nr:Do family serine endopeptidase [Desulfobacterales bacterium]
MWLNKLINSITRRRAFFMVLFLVMIILGVSCFNSVSDDKAKKSGSDNRSLAGMASSVTVPKPAEVRMIPESFSALAEMASPAVVNIRTVRTGKTGNIFRQFHKGPFGEDDQMEDFFNKFFNQDQQKEFKQRSLGSGFIIDKDGYIVTNNHVVENADKIKVILKDEKEFEAEIVGRDPNTDIALIRIKSGYNLPVLKIGDSDALKVGQWVLAIGSPFGLEHTVTAGIVSAKGRVIGSGPYDDFIQTDASINPGNSGGPLINMTGEVIGVNTIIIAGGQGIGFAIPINQVKGIVEQLKKHGDVTRGWLGVTIQDLPADLAEYIGIKDGKGVLVSDVISGDPADKAGIRPKDIIIEINGQKIESSRTLLKMVADIGVGEVAKIKVLRDGKEKTFHVEVAKRMDEKIASIKDSMKGQADETGIRVANLTPETAKRFGITEKEGVIVVGVDSGGEGAEAGIAPGDIIREVNHQAVKSVKDYTEAIGKIKKGETFKIFLWRSKVGFIIAKLTK